MLSIGIIGGSDGPTSVLVGSSNFGLTEIIVSVAVVLSVIILTVFWFKKYKR